MISCVFRAPCLQAFGRHFGAWFTRGGPHMLEKQDIKRSRAARSNGNGNGTATHPSAKPTGTVSGKPATPGKTPAVAPFGLKLQRYFTAPGDDGFANVEWELRTAAITGENGKLVFEQRDVEGPKNG